MKNHIPMARRQAGLSLIELMVSIVIGLFLLAGTISIFISNKQSYYAQDDSSRVQETGRFAMDMILRDIRMAGYFGCMDSMSDVHNVLNASGVQGNLLNTNRAVEGLDESSGKWLPYNVAPTQTYGGPNVGDIVAGTDAITVRYASGLSWRLTADMATKEEDVPATANPAAPDGTVLSGDTLSQGQVVVLSDCAKAHVFAISAAPAPALAHATGASSNQNSTLTLDRYAKTQNASITPLVAVRYFIGRTATGADPMPALYQETYNVSTGLVDPEPVLPGVEDMQITYGLDTDGDGQVDKYVPATDADLNNTIANWNKVLSIKIGLLVRTVNERATNDPDNTTYTVNGTAYVAPGDRRKRRVLESVMYIRNKSQDRSD